MEEGSTSPQGTPLLAPGPKPHRAEQEGEEEREKEERGALGKPGSGFTGVASSTYSLAPSSEPGKG